MKGKKGIGTIGIVLIIVVLMMGTLFSILAWKKGFISGATVKIQEDTCKYGSAEITNNKEAFKCYDEGSGEIILRYNATRNYGLNDINTTAGAGGIGADVDLGHGYISIKADDGCLAYITVTAEGNSSYIQVREASPSEAFEDSGYEDYPVPPKFIEEGEALIYEYYVSVLYGKAVGWSNNTPQVVRLHVDIPEAGEPVPGCNRDVGDGVCEWDSLLLVRNLVFNCSTDMLDINGTDGTTLGNNMTRNCYAPRGDEMSTYCSVNSTCGFAVNGTSACW